MKIKKIAETLHISSRAVRFYEEKGLLSPPKNDSGYRTFDEADIRRLQVVIALREAGMPIEEIRRAIVTDASGEPEEPESIRRGLELQRSALAAKWIEAKRMLGYIDSLLDLLHERKTVPVKRMYRAAEQSRAIREARGDWNDRWNYDQLAFSHDELVGAETGEYADYERALELVAAWTSARESEEGLDLGTGTGNLAGKLLRQGARMAGVDQSEQMLKLCKAKFPQMEARFGNLLAIPFADGVFDFVVSSFALRHLTGEQVRLALAEMRRVMKSRGRLCIADLLFADESAKEAYADCFPGHGEYALLSDVVEWLERQDYMVKTRQLNALLHIVCAVPIR